MQSLFDYLEGPVAAFRKNSAIPARMLTEGGELTPGHFDWDYCFIDQSGFAVGVKAENLGFAFSRLNKYPFVAQKQKGNIVVYSIDELRQSLKPGTAADGAAGEMESPGALAADAGTKPRGRAKKKGPVEDADDNGTFKG